MEQETRDMAVIIRMRTATAYVIIGKTAVVMGTDTAADMAMDITEVMEAVMAEDAAGKKKFF